MATGFCDGVGAVWGIQDLARMWILDLRAGPHNQSQATLMCSIFNAHRDWKIDNLRHFVGTANSSSVVNTFGNFHIVDPHIWKDTTHTAMLQTPPCYRSR